MRISDVSRETRRVAVGTTREDAAAAFGLDHDELLLTTFAELADEVNLDRVTSLDLASGEALLATVDAACHQLQTTPDFSLRVQYTPGDSASLCEVLDRHAIAISDVQRRGRRFLLTLEAAGSSEPRNQVVLSALEASASARSEGRRTDFEPSPATMSESETPADVTETPHPQAASERSGRSHRVRPPLLRAYNTVNQLRRSRRQRAIMVIALAAVTLVLLAAGLLTDPSGPVASVLLALLIVLVLAATGVSVMTVLLLARQVHAQTGRIERVVRRNRAMLDSRTTGIARDVRTLAKAQERLPFMWDYLEAMAAANSSSAARIVDQIESLGAGAAGLHLDTQRQVQAVLNLHRLVEIHDRVPPMGGWAASADFNVLMLRELIGTRPRTVVECGSGTTTLLLALAVRQYGLSTRVVALEHLERLKAQTEQALRQHGVADFAEVRLAPLSPSSVPDHATPWYGEEALADLDKIGLLVVDGPPETTGEHARFPAVPLLRERMSPSCVVVVDDLNRPGDLEVVQSWKALLPDFEFEQLETFQKGAGVFRR